jgi:hypothetical protein
MMTQLLGVLVASLTAFVPFVGECGDCSWSDGDAVLCEQHEAQDDAALGSARRPLGRQGPYSTESRIVAAQSLAKTTHEHANAPSRKVAELLAGAVDHPDLAVRVAVILALQGQHPKIAAEGFVAAALEYVEVRKEFEAVALAPMKEVRSPAETSKKELLKDLERVQRELAERIAAFEDLATHDAAYYAAVVAGLESVAPGDDRDRSLGELIEVQSYVEGVRIVEILLSSGSPASLRQAVRPFEHRSDGISELEKELKAKRKERPKKRPKSFKDKAVWEERERARLDEEVADLEQRLSHPVAHLTEVQRLLQAHAEANDLPAVPDDPTSDRLWTSWARRAGAVIRKRQDG